MENNKAIPFSGPKALAQFVIVVLDNGQAQASGPWADPKLCMAACQAILNLSQAAMAQEAQKKILLASELMPVHPIRRMPVNGI